jgi:3-dehydroquinate dehydratase II
VNGVRSVLVLNGPNLNLLGTREPDVYGTATLADVEQLCRREAHRYGLETQTRQTNHEGELVDWLQEAGLGYAEARLVGVVLNAGGFTHTSVALRDAIVGAGVPTVEVHVSNVHAREDFRHHSLLSAVAAGVVVGFGIDGYALAIAGLARRAGLEPRAGA